ncbi:MAG TPA: glycine cleavage system protein GcvH [Dehalococcoidia bacterium]|nr:glycine cleavage system protein GcvH [Dehalococcoidia bacterium]
MKPQEYRYTQEHEWLCSESKNRAKIGITDYAQSQLGDIVFLDLPEPDSQVTQFEKMGEIETVKAVSDLFSPASGKVLERNQAVLDNLALVNEDPYGAGWLLKIELSQPAELEALMSSDEYEKFIAGLSQETSE